MHFNQSGSILKDQHIDLSLFHLTSIIPRAEVASQVAFAENKGKSIGQRNLEQKITVGISKTYTGNHGKERVGKGYMGVRIRTFKAPAYVCESRPHPCQGLDIY